MAMRVISLMDGSWFSFDSELWHSMPWGRPPQRMMEGLRLCKALWTGESVDWNGRWTVKSGVLGPVPYRKGGPPLWYGGRAEAALARTAKFFDGWFPNHADPARFDAEFARIRTLARQAGRDGGVADAATYLTLAIDEDAARANARMDDFMARYYNQPAVAKQMGQVNYAGPAEGAAALLADYARTGCTHLVLRFAGEHESQMREVAKIRAGLGWD